MAFNFELLHVRGKFAFEEPMSRHCSWRTGGSAERFFEPADVDDLIAYFQQVNEVELITWIGLGSNVLVRDGGVSGTVISTAKTLNNIAWLDHEHLQVECGTTCAKVAKEAARMALGGGGFLAGIPGTIGGALAMNAGRGPRATARSSTTREPLPLMLRDLSGRGTGPADRGSTRSIPTLVPSSDRSGRATGAMAP